MRYISSTEYQSHFRSLYAFSELYKGTNAYRLLNNVISTKIKYDEFKKSFQQQLYQLNQAAKEHHEHYMLFDYEQFELSSDDYYGIRHDLDHKISELPKTGEMLAKALCKEKAKLKEFNIDIFNTLQEKSLELSKEKEEQTLVVARLLQSVSQNLKLILRSFLSDNKDHAAFDPVKNGWEHRLNLKKSIHEKHYFFHSVNKLNVSERLKKIDLSEKILFTMPLTELMYCFECVDKETLEFNNEKIKECTETNNMKSEVKIIEKLVNLREKKEQVKSVYNQIKNIDINYKLIVLQ